MSDGIERPWWLTDERIAELEAIGLKVPEPDGCPCCGETQHGCGCPVAGIGLAILLASPDAPKKAGSKP